MARRTTPQRELPFRTWGGKRRGAGRKPRGDRPGVPHRRRAKVDANHPVHVTIRVRNDVAKLRNRTLLRLFHDAFEKARERFGGRLVHFSIQGNHVHFLVEAPHRGALARYMQGLQIRLARILNRHTGRAGKVFRDRYHAKALATPTQVRNALLYVLNNARKHAAEHGISFGKNWIDPYGSGAWFDGWRGPPPDRPGGEAPVARPRSWLMRVGWRRMGLLPIDGLPGAGRALTRSRG